MRGVKKHSLVSKMVLGLKKKRRKLLMSKIALKDDETGLLTTACVKKDGKFLRKNGFETVHLY